MNNVPGYVYLLLNGDRSPLYKIGCAATSRKSRIVELQTGNPYLLNLVLSLKTENYRSLETELHCIFGSRRVGGEWFRLCKADFEKLLNEDFLKRYQVTEIYKSPQFFDGDILTTLTPNPIVSSKEDIVIDDDMWNLP